MWGHSTGCRCGVCLTLQRVCRRIRDYSGEPGYIDFARIDYGCWQVKSRTSSTRDSETPGCERHLVVRDSSPWEVKGSQEVVQVEENEALDTKIK